MGGCIFCKIVRGEIPSSRVYEDDSTIAFMDINPLKPGHTLMIPRNHYERLTDMPGEELAAPWDFMYLIEAMDNAGNGWMWPDIETETPYVIVHLKRGRSRKK